MAQWVELEPRNLFPRRHSRLTVAHDSAALSKVVLPLSSCLPNGPICGQKEGKERGAQRRLSPQTQACPPATARALKSVSQPKPRTHSRVEGLQFFLESDPSQD